jgi:toxin YhaV
MKPMLCQGWRIYFHPLFFQQWQDLIKQVEHLKLKLEGDRFLKHPEVKLLKAINVGIREKIPLDPMAAYFRLQGPLRQFNRLKKMGLPPRYRLFFRVFPQEKAIIILWLGFPRKAGDQKDCYRVFEKMLKNNQFSPTMEELLNLRNSEPSSDQI